MNNKLRYFGNQLMIVVFLVSLLLTALGGVLYQVVRLATNDIVYDRISSESQELADYFYSDLESEMDTLEHMTNLLTDTRTAVMNDNVIRVQHLIDDVFYNEPRIIIGLSTATNKNLFGYKLPANEYQGLLNAMTGQRTTTYTSGGGVLYTYPVMRSDNVHYVLYMICSSQYILEKHNIQNFCNMGKVKVMTKTGNDIVPFTGLTEEESRLLESVAIKNEFLKLGRNYNRESSSIAEKKTILGDMFLYSADIAGTDFMVVGAIPREEAYGAMMRIPSLIMTVYLIFVLIVIGLAIYLIIMSVRVRESEELKQAKDQAETALKAKSDFLSSMSHEIRTPINAVLGFDELILREYDDLQLRKYALNIKHSITSLLNLVNDVLDYSRMEAKKVTLIPKPYDVSMMITDMLAIIQQKADAKGLKFDAVANQEMPSVLVGDLTRLKQVILNLLTNGVKYTNEGFVNLILDYEKIDDKNIYLLVTVKDSGIGMKPEDINKLFDAFERFDEDKNRTVEGTGLGMNIVKNLLELMGSKIEVESVYGAGSIFKFKVKQEVFDWRPIGDYKATYEESLKKEIEYQSKLYAPKANILVVDDTEMNLMVVKGLLKNTGMNIITATSGADALECINSKVFDIMLIDQRMPGMDGFELLKHIRDNTENQNHDKICIALTANTIEGIREKCLSAGFDDYLEKPVDGKTLERTIIKLLPDELIERHDKNEPILKSGFDERTAAELDDSGAEQYALFGSQQNSSKNNSSVSVDKSASDNETTTENAEIMEKLKELEAEGYVNIEDGISYAGSEEMFIMTVEFFRDSINSKADEIEEYYLHEDYENYSAKVHALKSSARIIGAARLSNMAMKLEKAANDKNFEFVHNNNMELLSSYRSFITILKDI